MVRTHGLLVTMRNKRDEQFLFEYVMIVDIPYMNLTVVEHMVV